MLTTWGEPALRRLDPNIGGDLSFSLVHYFVSEKPQESCIILEF